MRERFLVLGCGERGCAAARELLAASARHRVLLADRSREALAAGVAWILARESAALGRLRSEILDAGEPQAVARLAREAEVILSALPPGLEPALARAALGAGFPLVGLGGDDATVAQLLALDAEARRRGVALVAGCAGAPTARAVLARAGEGALGELPAPADERWLGLPAALAAQMIARREVAEGAWAAERLIPPRSLLAEAERRGLHLDFHGRMPAKEPDR
ncbi:MAG: saccharopine dehydrogenase NADP-binding domain-containing protein [Thermoanaerobaculia bacterium]